MATANASVDTARWMPRSRSAGSPTSTATAAPTRPMSGATRARSRPHSAAALAPRAAPMATMAIWPRETCPAQPVTIAMDRVITAKISTAPALSVLPGSPTQGR